MISRNITQALILAVLSAVLLPGCTCARSDKADAAEITEETALAWFNDGDYAVKDGKISEKVLRNYLSRAITEAEYCCSPGLNTDGYFGTEDDERMLLNIGAKFIGRSLYTWNGEQKFNNPQWLDGAKEKIDRYHQKDPAAIFQAAIFETVSKGGLESVAIPDWVFEAFGKAPERRNFSFDAIRDENGVFLNQWGKDTAVPDMSREEAQMWFYYVAVRYIEAGIEALHMGQVNLMCSMGDKADGYAGWLKMQSLIRDAAKTKARRGFVLMDAHCPGIVVEGKHLFDFASFPMRLKEKTGSTAMEAELRKGYLDSIVGKTVAGTTPSGWKTKRLPYIVEFDNFGISDHPGAAGEDIYVWGYDEVTWIGMVTEEYAREFVKTTCAFLENTDPMGYLQMPGCRIVYATGDGVYYPYRCNTKSDACPTGRNLEQTIKELWTTGGK